MGELGRLVGIGAGVMTAPALDTPRRPWDFVRRALAAVGLSGRGLVLAAPVLWMTIFFLVPLAVVFGISLAIKEFGRPPFSDLLTTTETGTVQLTLHLNNYIRLFTDSNYVEDKLNSIQIALISNIIALLI